MLRITVHDESGATTLKLEGKVTGPWVPRIGSSLAVADRLIGDKETGGGLTRVTHMDADWEARSCRNLHREPARSFSRTTPMTKYFAEQAQLKNMNDAKENG